MSLVTLEEFKTYQGIDLADTTRDVTLQGLLDTITDAIVRETGRDLTMVPANDDDPDVMRTVEYRLGEPFIDLYPYEARSISDVVIDPNGLSPYTLLATEYQLAPIVPRDGVYDRIRLGRDMRFHTVGFDQVPVAVTGRWGWVTVPQFIKDWVLELTEDRYAEDVAAFADAAGNVVAGPVTIPYRIQDEMAAIRRTYIGGV